MHKYTPELESKKRAYRLQGPRAKPVRVKLRELLKISVVEVARTELLRGCRTGRLRRTESHGYWDVPYSHPGKSEA
jgi:hypothetical protein